MATNIWWIRRDVRLFDNPALHAALAKGPAIIPVFIWDEALLASSYMCARRTAFLAEGLRLLDEALRQRGSQLLVLHGRPLSLLRQLLAETGATAVYAQRDVSPYSKKRDKQIAAELPLILTDGVAIRPTDAVYKDDGKPYTVFTPYKKRWLSLVLPRTADLLPIPERIPTPKLSQSSSLPSSNPTSPLFPAGEAAGRARLHAFVNGDGLRHYAALRNNMDVDGTSSLSPYLRLGMVSAREAAVLALQAIGRAKGQEERDGPETWLSELIWREFYLQILDQFPHVRGGSFRPEYDQIAWRNAPDEFAAWCAGQTGYPIVDAAMRQLNETGWMHNRARMIVASFLVKELLIDWRWGERYFMQQLLDGDPASNNGGWQWTAGTGTDAAPYFRIFNPASQAQKFDPDGRYTRRWVPELAAVPAKYLAEPWTMPPLVQHGVQCVIGRDYPAPLVDRAVTRERTLAAYKAVSSK